MILSFRPFSIIAVFLVGVMPAWGGDLDLIQIVDPLGAVDACSLRNQRDISQLVHDSDLEASLIFDASIREGNKKAQALAPDASLPIDASLAGIFDANQPGQGELRHQLEEQLGSIQDALRSDLDPGESADLRFRMTRDRPDFVIKNVKLEERLFFTRAHLLFAKAQPPTSADRIRQVLLAAHLRLWVLGARSLSRVTLGGLQRNAQERVAAMTAYLGFLKVAVAAVKNPSSIQPEPSDPQDLGGFRRDLASLDSAISLTSVQLQRATLTHLWQLKQGQFARLSPASACQTGLDEQRLPAASGRKDKADDTEPGLTAPAVTPRQSFPVEERGSGAD